MAALMFGVPEATKQVLRGIEVPGTPVHDDYHTTVIYFGDDVPVDVLGDVVVATYEVTSHYPPFNLSTKRVATFPEGDDGVPVIALLHSPELHDMRQELIEVFDSLDIEYNKKWPVFRPHVTLSYAPAGPKVNAYDVSLQELSWPAHELLLWGADRGTGRLIVKFPLSLPKGKAAADDYDRLRRSLIRLAMYGQRESSA